MKSRRDENFLTTKLTSLSSDVEDVYTNEQFTEVANSFYTPTEYVSLDTT
jgi:hypothetical protein